MLWKNMYVVTVDYILLFTSSLFPSTSDGLAGRWITCVFSTLRLCTVFVIVMVFSDNNLYD